MGVRQASSNEQWRFLFFFVQTPVAVWAVKGLLHVVSEPQVCHREQRKNKQENVVKVRKRTALGQYVVADPEICHGQLTFTGTRIMVKSVLYYVAQGKDWDWISQEYYGRVSREAIAEAVSLASDALLEKMGEQRRHAA